MKKFMKQTMKKKRLYVGRWFIVMLLFLISGYFSIRAKANVFELELEPHYVTDLDNIIYPSTSQYYAIDGIQGSEKFIIHAPTIVKSFFSWDMTTTKNISGMAWFSRDPNGIDIIGESVKLSKTGDNLMVFLDPGIYYINHFFQIKDSSYGSYLRVGVALLAENTGSTEEYYESSYFNPNNIKLNKSVRGFLSNSSPLDYYKFTITEKSQVHISYNFEQTGNERVNTGLCTLYDSENQKLISKNFNPSGAGNNIITYMLEPGVYYLSLSGAKAATNLKIEGISYEVDLIPNITKPTNKDITIKLDTEFEPTQILYVAKEISNGKIKDVSIWNARSKTCFEVDLDTFTVSENGIYTVRLKDASNHYILKTIEVNNIDKTAPKVTGVSKNKTYKINTVVKFSDSGSGIKKATLNGKAIKSGYKIKASGKMQLKVYDKAGNVRTVAFTIAKNSGSKK